MVTLLEKELEFEKGIKKNFDIIGSFIGCKPEFINGSIKTIDKTNITYVEPHRIIYKGITFLYFNFTNEVYVKSLDKKIKISEIEDYSNFKMEKEFLNDELERLDNEAFKVRVDSEYMSEMIDSLPQSKINKNHYILTDKEKEKINNFIKEAKEATNDMLSTNNLNAVLKKYEQRLKNQDKEIKKLKDTIRRHEDNAKHNSEVFYDTLGNYYKEQSERYKYEKENNKLVQAIDLATGTINGLCNWIYELCADGYIPQHKME